MTSQVKVNLCIALYIYLFTIHITILLHNHYSYYCILTCDLYILLVVTLHITLINLVAAVVVF